MKPTAVNGFGAIEAKSGIVFPADLLRKIEVVCWDGSVQHLNLSVQELNNNVKQLPILVTYKENRLCLWTEV